MPSKIWQTVGDAISAMNVMTLDSIMNRQLEISKNLYKKRSICEKKDSIIGREIHNV